MSIQCPPLNKNDSTENEFNYRCADDVFSKIVYRWGPIDQKYFSYINSINDHILRYIFFYFVQYYIDGHKYYRDSEDMHRNSACGHLKEWLGKKKDLYTFGKRCKAKLMLWEDKIPELWNMLKSDYTLSGKRNTQPWCNNNYELDILTTFPTEVTQTNCEESISQEPYIEVPLPKESTTCCKCPENEVADRSHITENTPDIQPTRKIAFTSGLTTAGTVGTLLLLYKYTPVSSWFRRRGMNNIGSDLYMNPGSPDGFLRLQHDNGSNNLFYQP